MEAEMKWYHVVYKGNKYRVGAYTHAQAMVIAAKLYWKAHAEAEAYGSFYG